MPVNETMEMNVKRFFLRWKILFCSVRANEPRRVDAKEKIFSSLNLIRLMIWKMNIVMSQGRLPPWK